MLQISRRGIEGIANRVIDAYKRLPEISEEEITCVDPELLTRQLLGLKLDYCRLSKDGSLFGITSFSRLEIEIFDDPNEQRFYSLDGKTVLIESALKEDDELIGSYHFALTHEISHRILSMLFPGIYNGSVKEPLMCLVSKPYRASGEEIDWYEWQANTLASALLMPKDLVIRGMERHGLGRQIQILNRVFRPQAYKAFSELACSLGVSKQALAIRMKHLGLLDKEYLENPYALVNIWMDDCEEGL